MKPYLRKYLFGFKKIRKIVVKKTLILVKMYAFDSSNQKISEVLVQIENGFKGKICLNKKKKNTRQNAPTRKSKYEYHEKF